MKSIFLALGLLAIATPAPAAKNTTKAAKRSPSSEAQLDPQCLASIKKNMRAFYSTVESFVKTQDVIQRSESGDEEERAEAKAKFETMKPLLTALTTVKESKPVTDEGQIEVLTSFCEKHLSFWDYLKTN